MCTKNANNKGSATTIATTAQIRLKHTIQKLLASHKKHNTQKQTHLPIKRTCSVRCWLQSHPGHCYYVEPPPECCLRHDVKTHLSIDLIPVKHLRSRWKIVHENYSSYKLPQSILIHSGVATRPSSLVLILHCSLALKESRPRKKPHKMNWHFLTSCWVSWSSLQLSLANVNCSLIERYRGDTFPVMHRHCIPLIRHRLRRRRHLYCLNSYVLPWLHILFLLGCLFLLLCLTWLPWCHVFC